MANTTYTSQEILNKCFDETHNNLSGGSSNQSGTKYTEQEIFNKIFNSSTNSLNLE